MEKYNLDDKGGLFRFLAKSPMKIVKNGESIEFKHPGNQSFIKASVLNVSEPSIKIQAKEKMQDPGIAVNDHILLHYNPSGDFMVITGEIASIDNNDPFEATVRVVKIEKLKDLAKEKKCCASLMGSFKIIGVADGKPAFIKAVSNGGIKANCVEDIMMEDIIDITIYVNKNSKMNCKGRIVRKTKLAGTNEYGIEYTELMESSMKAVTDLLFQSESLL